MKIIFLLAAFKTRSTETLAVVHMRFVQPFLMLQCYDKDKVVPVLN